MLEQGQKQTRGSPCSPALGPQVKLRLLPVELPLVAGELEAVDEQLGCAESTLFWHHEGTNTPEARDPLCVLWGVPGTFPPLAKHPPSGPQNRGWVRWGLDSVPPL